MAFALRFTSAFALCVALSISAAAEQVSEPRDIPQDKVCSGNPGEGTLGAEFLDWVLDNYGITRECERSVGKDNILVAEAPWTRSSCKKQEKSINLARSLAARVLEGGEATQGYFKSNWGLQNPIKMSEEERIESFIKKQVTVSCLKKSGKKEDRSFRISDTKIGDWRLKLRLDQSSLEYDKIDGEKYKKAKSAKFGYSNDGLKNEAKYEVNGTVGLASPNAPCGLGAVCQFIPYVKREQTVTTPKAGKGDKETTTYGSVGFVRWKPTDWLNTITSFDTHYILDQGKEGDTEVLGHTLRWRPSLAIGNETFPGRFIPLFNESIAFGYEYGAVMRYGRTLENGGNPIFEQQKDFLYAGAELDVVFLGIKGSIFENLKLLLHYHMLYREHGVFRQVPYFNAELSYSLDKDGDVDISLTYQRGREYETFEERDILKAALGYKF